jgi:hypothetical protein
MIQKIFIQYRLFIPLSSSPYNGIDDDNPWDPNISLG